MINALLYELFDVLIEVFRDELIDGMIDSFIHVFIDVLIDGLIDKLLNGLIDAFFNGLLSLQTTDTALLFTSVSEPNYRRVSWRLHPRF